jgi:ABC-type polar amino acid transport system ATPase subunit
MIEDISHYTSEGFDESLWMVVVKGKQGSGKSLFARCLMIEALKR